MENNAKNLDQWFTKPEVSAWCVNKVMKLGLINAHSHIIEPSAGGGAFLDVLYAIADSVQGYDLDPKRDDIIEMDFLKNTIRYDENNVVIGNPPYGKKAKLAVEFINKAMGIADHICFIVPLTLAESYSAQRHVDPKLFLLFETELPKNSFTFEGKETDVPSVFQIWSKTPTKYDFRLKPPITEVSGLDIKIYNKTEGAKKWLSWDWTVAVKRNSKKGEYITDHSLIEDKSHWILIKGDLSILETIDYSKLNDNKMTAGMGKADVVRAYTNAHRLLRRKS